MKIIQFTVCFCVDDEVKYLKTGICNRDAIISKLMKEKSQLQERVTSSEKQSIKEISSIGVQFNYLVPSMGKSIIV